MSLNFFRGVVPFAFVVGRKQNLVLASRYENNFIPFVHFVSFRFGLYLFLFNSRCNGKYNFLKLEVILFYGPY